MFSNSQRGRKGIRMEPKFRFKDYVVVNKDVKFWGDIKGQIIDFEEYHTMDYKANKMVIKYKYLIKIKRSSAVQWFKEDELNSRNSEVNPELIGECYD